MPAKMAPPSTRRLTSTCSRRNRVADAIALKMLA